MCVSTCGTELLSVSPSLEGIANAVRDLMVIFRSPQLDDLGSEDSRAYNETTFTYNGRLTRKLGSHTFDMIWNDMRLRK